MSASAAQGTLIGSHMRPAHPEHLTNEAASGTSTLIAVTEKPVFTAKK